MGRKIETTQGPIKYLTCQRLLLVALCFADARSPWRKLLSFPVVSIGTTTSGKDFSSIQRPIVNDKMPLMNKTSTVN